MHVLHLETGRSIYGGARQVQMLSAGLVAAGVRNTLVCPADSAIATAVHDAVDVQTVPFGGDFDARLLARLGTILRTVRPDIVHVHSRRGADLWGGLAARRAGVPAVLSRRVDNPEPRMLARLKYRNYAHIVAISNAVRAQLEDDGVAGSDISVVHSAIDAEACRPSWTADELRREFGYDAQHRVVMCVAQLIPRKGHLLLLDAWATVMGAHPDARLLVLGRGPEEAAIRTQIAAAGLEENVQLAGFRADVREFLGCADMLVHPATREGLGICLLEAQAAGLPVIATAAGGMQEAVVDDVTGLLFAPGDSAALADRLATLLGNAELRRQLGEAGAQHVRKQFSPTTMIEGNLKVYTDIMRAHRES